MKLHKRVTACLLVCGVIAASVGCTSMKTVRPVTGALAPPFGKVKAGDTVEVQTPDGDRVRFVVDQVDDDAIISREGVRYTRADIVQLKRKSFNFWTTALLIYLVPFVYLAVPLPWRT